MFDYLLYGILTGSVLLLGSVGFSIIRQVEGYLDIGYGQYIAIGAYISWYLYSLDIHIILASVLAVGSTSLLALLCNIIFYKPIRSYGNVMLLFTSVGVAFLLNGAIEAIWGVSAKNFNVPVPHVFHLGDTFMVTSTELVIILVAFLATLAIHILFKKTKIGKAIRAMASNFQLANIRGIDTSKMSSYVHLIAGALGGLAGVIMGISGTLYPDIGWSQILLILSAVILAGLQGSIYGVMLAAMLMGVGIELSSMVLPSAYDTAVAFVVIIVVLFIKPEGLFRRR
ncbi:MAG: branched-chain amino acid ABC transporter permease [Thermodesulfobacteriota bacterium]